MRMKNNIIVTGFLTIIGVFFAIITATGAHAQTLAFQSNLGIGSAGDDVVSLQALLEASGFLTMPAGVAKGYFGPLTKRALSAYQAEVGLPATGFFGPMTRGKVSEHVSATPTAGAKSANVVKNSALCVAGQQCQDVVVDDCVVDNRWAGGMATTGRPTNLIPLPMPMPPMEMNQKDPRSGSTEGGGAAGSMGGGNEKPIPPQVASSSYLPNPAYRTGNAVVGGIVPPRVGGDIVSGTISGNLRSGTVRRCLPRPIPMPSDDMPVISTVPATR